MLSLRSLSALLAALVAAMALGMPAAAAEQVVAIRLRPHCDAAFFGTAAGGPAPCTEFPEHDPETLVLNGVQAGGTVDVDVVLANPSGQPLQSVQSWLAYDPKVLRGREVRIAETFPLVAPGEQAFSEGPGIVKLGASNVSGGVRAEEMTFARVTFDVLATPATPVVLHFHEFSLLGQEGKTKVLIVEGGRTVNVLRTRPKDLLLSSAAAPPQPVLPLVPPSLLPVPLPVPADDGFTRLQPSGLRIATEDDRVYLLWDPFADPRVVGTNIYYGTVSGRYIQRRTVGSGVHGVTIRGLPLGKRYSFAITGYDALERETEFSYEVAVVVGDPQSSTAPFDPTAFALGRGLPDVPGPDGDLRGSVIGRGRVPGATGGPLTGIILLASAMVAGAALWRRRVSSSRS